MSHVETHTPQQAWWLEQAQNTIRRSSIPAAKITWLAQTHNAVFLVEHDSERYILTLQKRNDAALLRLISQKMLMQTVAQAGFALPIPLELLLTPEVQGMLTQYVQGDAHKPHTLTPEDSYAVGGYLARLHHLRPELHIAGAVRPVLDADGLFSKQGIYYPGDENMGIFTGAQLLTMQEVAGKVRTTMEILGTGADEYGIIHADLLLHNILFHEGEVRALDWEYSGWGYFLYDLTPLLWQMKPQPNYAEIQAALWDGYTRVRPLTEEHRELLETLIAGRQVASMRWVAANQQNPHYMGNVERILAQRTAELRGFLDTGILQRRV